MKNITPNMVDALGVATKKVYNPKNFIYLAVYAALAIACVAVLVVGSLDSAGALYYIVVMAATVGIIGMLYYAIAGSKVLRTADGRVLRTAEFYYASGTARSLYDALAHADVQAVAKLQKVEEGGVRLDIISDPERTFGVAQVFVYEPYQYNAYQDVIKLDAALLAALLK